MVAVVHATELDKRIEELRGRTASHLKAGSAMLEADGGTVFAMDWLAAAVLNRSVRLINGFADLIPHNFMSAAPLIRMQLDNFLRFHAAFFVATPHDFVLEVLNGQPIRKMTDLDGKQLTDGHLLHLAAKNFPDLRYIYNKGCEYVHLSDTHILHAILPQSDGSYNISIGRDEVEVTPETRVDAADAMIHLTDYLLRLVGNWSYTKNNPQIASDPIVYVHALVAEGKTDEACKCLHSLIATHPDVGIVAKGKAVLATLAIT